MLPNTLPGAIPELSGASSRGSPRSEASSVFWAAVWELIGDRAVAVAINPSTWGGWTVGRLASDAIGLD